MRRIPSENARRESKDAFGNGPHSANAEATFGKRPSQIRKTPQPDSENAPENVHPRLCRLLAFVSGFYTQAKRRQFNIRKSPHSENAAARFGKSRSQIGKTPLKTYDHVCLGYYILPPSFPASAPARAGKKRNINIRRSQIRKTPQPDLENAASRFGKRK